tara:strand:+ start:1209 stop:1775 length:567 start_codon:yes stop_codon:yes gene_type:complete
MYDEFTLEYKCRAEGCANFAEYYLWENSHGNFAGNCCKQCEPEESRGPCVTSSRIERGLGDWWEIAEQMGWVNPIDTLFNKYGVDNPEDLPEHEQAGYGSAVDEAEAEAIDYIFKNFPDHITQSITVRFSSELDGGYVEKTYSFVSEEEAQAFREGLAEAVGWNWYEIVYPDEVLDEIIKFEERIEGT